MNWIALSFLSLIFVGLGNFLFRMATAAGQSPMGATIVGFFAQMVLGVLIILIFKPQFNLSASALMWPSLAGIFLGIGIVLVVIAMAKPDAQVGIVAAIMNSNFLLVSLLAWLCLCQPLSLKQIMGFLVVLGGMALMF